METSLFDTGLGPSELHLSDQLLYTDIAYISQEWRHCSCLPIYF